MAALAPSTKEQLVLVAERLFAEHGIQGVSLRQICATAGIGNNSAVQYHFGSKDQFVRAIFEYRLPHLLARRDFLIAELRPHDLRSWVECQLRAVLEQSEVEGSNYMTFVAVVYQYGPRDLFEQMPEDVITSTRTYQDHLTTLLRHIEEPLRSHRTAQAMALMVHAAADRERARAAGRSVVPFVVALGDLLDGLVGFLEAPVSVETRAALERTDMSHVTWSLLL